MLSFICRQLPPGFDDEAEFQYAKPTSRKPISTITYRQYRRSAEMGSAPPYVSQKIKRPEIENLTAENLHGTLG